MTIVALRRVGIDEAFVQQAAEDEEAEFQRAFERRAGARAASARWRSRALAPVLAAVYDDDRLLALTLGVAYLPVAFALQAPQWVFFRADGLRAAAAAAGDRAARDRGRRRCRCCSRASACGRS